MVRAKAAKTTTMSTADFDYTYSMLSELEQNLKEIEKSLSGQETSRIPKHQTLRKIAHYEPNQACVDPI